MATPIEHIAEARADDPVNRRTGQPSSLGSRQIDAHLALAEVTRELEAAIAAPKCHKCGCLQTTVEALSNTSVGRNELTAVLETARSVFVPKRYDCLGCAVCFPALAANAFAEAYPEAGGGLDLCPTEEPEARDGWPPLPGDYHVIRYGAPVAVCTLNSADLARTLADARPDGLAIAGTMHTENLGIERLITNILANPEIRFLILSGEDTQQAVGHLPGQALQSLFERGVDERRRIVGARGKRPVLNNVTSEEIAGFCAQIELVAMIGVSDADQLTAQISACAARSPGASRPFRSASAPRIQAGEPERLTLDKAGYFVVYPEQRRHSLVVEHYKNSGVLDCVIEGKSPAAIYSEAIARELISRFDHAAYLGRELARAEESLLGGRPYQQDAAPGKLLESAEDQACNDASCGCGLVT